MIFSTHEFKGPLLNYVESMFHFSEFNPDHSIERVVPTGHVFVIFELDGITRNTFDNDTLKPLGTFKNVWVSGAHKNYISISAHPNSEMFVFQFKPYGALPFIHQSIDSLNDQVVTAEQVFGSDILELRHAIKAAKTAKDKLDLGADWLLNRFDKSRLPPKELVDLMVALQNQPVVKYHEVIENYSKTQKHLIDQFKKYVGLTPKYYQRMLRFNDILSKVQSQQQVSWSEIAYQCGYADQSHFIKEFKTFSGFNPAEFIDKSMQAGEPNFFPLDQ